MVKKYLYISLLLFFACKEKELIKIPLQNDLPVVHAFLSDSLSEQLVYLVKTQGIGESLAIQNAEVWILDANQKRYPLFYDGLEAYKTETDSFTPILGNQYNLLINWNGKAIEARCKFPKQGAERVIFKLDTFTNVLGNFNCQLALSWNTKPSAIYYAKATLMGEAEIDGIPSLVFDDLMQSPGDFIFQSGKNETQIEKKLQQVTTHSNYKPLQLSFEIYSVDEDYFRYHKSLQKLNSTGNLFPEPYQIYSNVVGGLGVFCSSRRILKQEITF